MLDANLQQLGAEVASLGRKAGALIRSIVPEEIHFKGAMDLVTEADRRSQDYLVRELSSLWPQAGMLAEEGVHPSTEPEYLWVVDPLDGTTNFAHGYPVYAVSIGLLHRRQPILGVVYDPSRDECFQASRGGGAFLNDSPLRVSNPKGLKDALLASGFPYDTWTSDRDNLLQFSTFAKQVRGLRRGGSAALDLAYVAAGRLDGFWEEKLSPWDLAAAVLLVQEAGGRVTGYLGLEIDLWDGHVVAAEARLHGEMIAVLRAIEEAGTLSPLKPRFKASDS